MVTQQVKYKGTAHVTQDSACPQGNGSVLFREELVNKGKKAAAARERGTHKEVKQRVWRAMSVQRSRYLCLAQLGN